MTAEEIRAAVRSFPNCSASGLDGLRPQHLKDLLSLQNETEEKLAEALASLTNLMLRGEVPEATRQRLYGATLMPLSKKDGGIRPIAVGNTIRRLVGKVVSRRVTDLMGQHLRPRQLGFGTKGGAEAAVHATRGFLLEETGAQKSF